MVDLERTTTFSDFNDADYKEMESGELGMMDEEKINWKMLITRVFSLFLLLLIIICFSLEAIEQRFVFLGAIIGGLLILVIIATYIDLRRIFCFCIYKPSLEPPAPTLPLTHTGPSKNPLRTSTSSVSSSHL